MRLCIRKAVVLGAGVMGAAIAGHLAGNGVEVVLLDMPMREGERNKLAAEAKKRLLNPKARMLYARSAGDLIQIGNLEDDLDQTADADWVIEAIVERLEPKIDLFQKVAALVKPGCILSSNTSGISVNAIAQGIPAEQSKHFLGTHFFNPPRYMKLLELIPVKETDPEVMDAVASFAVRRLGKTIVRAKDTANFVANRIGVAAGAYLMKAIEQYDLSVSAADFLTGRLIERPASGNLKTFDLVGLDIVKATTQTNHAAEKNPEEKAVMVLPGYLVRMMELGLLGNKSGAGFYKKEGKTSLMWDRKSETYVPAVYKAPASVNLKAPVSERVFAMINSGTPEGDALWDLLKNLLVYCANRVPEIADEFTAIDRAMRLGYNWTMGPFQLWDALGTEVFNARLAAEGVALPAWVEEHWKKNGGKFYSPELAASLGEHSLSITDEALPVVWQSAGGEVLLKDLGDGVGAIVIATPTTALSTPAVLGVAAAVKQAEAKFEAAVLTSSGKNFCAGADLRGILNLIDQEQWSGIDREAAYFQDMTAAVQYAFIPIVAAPFGAAINRYCSSGLQAIATAAYTIVSGQQKVVLAGGVESMSTIPMGGARNLPNPDLMEKAPDYYISMGLTAENVAARYNITRERMDAFSVESHQKAWAAQQEGRMAEEIIPIQAVAPGKTIRAQTRFPFDRDEGIRPQTTLESLGKLRPVFKKDGVVTAGNASQMTDGASIVLLMEEEYAKVMGLKPLARFMSFAVAGVEPGIMGIGPVKAIPKALEAAGLRLEDIDVVELNEAFASQALACMDVLGIDPEKVNANGGAIALGHPLGCTGASLTVKVLHQLKRTNGRYGLVSMCIGGGQGAAGIFERV